MLILGIDTSCDDTAASVVENGSRIISNIVSTQDEIHKKYGGIVPELASRRHVEMIWPVVDEALNKADVRLDNISAIAVCHGPGLIGSLLVGVCFAKSLAYVYKKPLLAVNHLEGHIFSSFLEDAKRPEYPALEFPFVALIVSGGHTNIYRVKGFDTYTELGKTRDDAAGEAFDKVAKLLGLGYPGGPIIDKLAQEGNSQAISFPRAYLPGSFDFSFSGLKTSVAQFLRRLNINSELRTTRLSSPKSPNSQLIYDIAASFQSAAVDVLVEKTMEAAKREGMDKVVLAGGVSANRALRQAMEKRAQKEKISVYLLSTYLCTDNAAMIACAGFHHFKHEKFANFDLNPKAYLPLGSAYS